MIQVTKVGLHGSSIRLAVVDHGRHIEFLDDTQSLRFTAPIRELHYDGDRSLYYDLSGRGGWRLKLEFQDCVKVMDYVDKKKVEQKEKNFKITRNNELQSCASIRVGPNQGDDE